MLRFHTNIFVMPSDCGSGPVVKLRGYELATLIGGAGGPPIFANHHVVTFEAAQARLLTIPRMDVEPDGYFLAAGGESEGNRWQVDGHLYELGGGLHRVELSGSCPTDVFDQLLHSIGWPESKLVFELVREGVTLVEADFRAWARE